MRRAVVAVEGGDEEKGYGELGETRSHEELSVLPVLAVGGGGHGDDGDRADLRGEKGETGGPPRDAAAREEEILRPLLLTAERAADDNQRGQRRRQDGEVGPRQRRLDGLGHGLAPLWLKPPGFAED